MLNSKIKKLFRSDVSKKFWTYKYAILGLFLNLKIIMLKNNFDQNFEMFY